MILDWRVWQTGRYAERMEWKALIGVYVGPRSQSPLRALQVYQKQQSIEETC